MTRTPPLAPRVVTLGVLVLAVMLVVVNSAVFLVLRERLDSSVDLLLAERAELVQGQADAVRAGGGGPEELAESLQARGLRVLIQTPTGETFAADPQSPVVGPGLPAGRVSADRPVRTRTVPLDDGVTAEVFASTAGVTSALRELLLLQVVASVVALVLAALLLHRAARVALAPVGAIAASASLTARGHLGERLRPDQPGTELGRMATAYDAMLDELETSLQAARDVKGARALLAAVVDGSTDAIVVQDLEGRILTWNSAAQQLLGWSSDEAVGQDVSLVVPEAELPQLRGLVAEVAADGKVRGYEGERLARNGERLPVSVRLSPVRDADAGIVAVAVGARDVTEQRWMASTLNSTLAALQQAADDAKASEESTRRFLADAAHQLRTPMTGIRACAETLLRGASQEDADLLMATMVRETSRAARLIASLLRMARLDQGLPLAVEPVDLVAVCREEVERLGLLSPDLSVTLDTGPGAGTALADPAACREIVSNLGDNARRHAESRIVVVVDAAEQRVRVRMVDDGPGLHGAARTEVFERFVSLDGRGGSGLGLPIARALATAMGGDLLYDDGFLLWLPASESRPLGPAAGAAG
jgi:PAS domain S-box-containing protein